MIDYSQISFEDAFRRLEEISRKLDDPATALEISFQLFEEGQALLSHCQKLLDEAERRIQIIKSGRDGLTSEEVALV